MTIEADIVTALSGVADDRVFPNAAPESVPAPLIIMRRIGYDPLMLLTGSAGIAKSTFIFMCWGAKTGDTPETRKGAKKRAMELASDVRAAINGDSSGSSFTSFFEEPVDSDDFEPETLEIMEPVSFSFWHGV